MDMTQRYRQRVRCIVGMGEFFQMKNVFHHKLNLLFGRRAGSYDGLLYLPWRVFCDRNPRIRSRQENDSPSMSEPKRSLYVLAVEDILHRYLIRLKLSQPIG